MQDVSLGSWDTRVTATSSATEEAGALPPSSATEPQATDALPDADESSDDAPPTSDAGPLVSLPGCLETAVPGEWSAIGLPFAPTETSTDWNLPDPVQSLSWSMMIERDVSPTASVDRTNGYYWLQQFSFVPGVSGRFGLQSQGVYQSEPTDVVEFTKIAVFWLSGTPLAAELGDIAFPDARVAPLSAAGTDWLTIHARFDWQVCRVYQFHVELDSTEPDGSMWYAARIEDTTTNDNTLLGRVLLPADTGLLSPFSVSRTVVIDFAPASCSVIEPGAALFGAPVGNGNVAVRSESRFTVPHGCAPSRFTAFPHAVRQELGGASVN